jgi:hypothetical protein
VASTLQGVSWLRGSGRIPPPLKNIENLDAKSCNLRVFWSENVFPKKRVLRMFFSLMNIMKFDMIGKEHRTMISQFSPSIISKTHNTMKQNTANVIPFQST